MITAAWWRRWQQAREERVLRRRAIPDALWRSTLERYPFLVRKPEDDQSLRRLSALFLDRKEFSGAQGLVVTDEMAVAIAAQACLPVLRIGLTPYDGFVGIVVHRDEVVVPRQITDQAGVVHAYEEVLVGEAMDGGPMMLSWRDVQAAGSAASWSYNVVIHEFVHVIDMLDGRADGVPPLPDVAWKRRWVETFESEYSIFCRRVDRQAPTILDPYGSTAPEEFFAVAAEAFFVNPTEMRNEHPRLYRLFTDFFRQDPAGE